MNLLIDWKHFYQMLLVFVISIGICQPTQAQYSLCSSGFSIFRNNLYQVDSPAYLGLLVAEKFQQRIAACESAECMGKIMKELENYPLTELQKSKLPKSMIEVKKYAKWAINKARSAPNKMTRFLVLGSVVTGLALSSQLIHENHMTLAIFLAFIAGTVVNSVSLAVVGRFQNESQKLAFRFYNGVKIKDFLIHKYSFQSWDEGYTHFGPNELMGIGMINQVATASSSMLIDLQSLAKNLQFNKAGEKIANLAIYQIEYNRHIDHNYPLFERLFKSYKIQLDPLGYEQARKAYFDELYKYDIENLNSSARLKDVNLQENQEKYSDFFDQLVELR